MTILACAVTVIATLAVVGWVQRRQYDASHLLDVAPYVAPAEPWPGYTPTARDRQRHWQVGTEQYDIQNVIRKAWRYEH